MTDTTGEGASLRQQLGAELRRLRDLAGLSGRHLATTVGVSQATLSRIEAGERAPSKPEVAAWCEATSADARTTSHLLQLAEAARTAIAPWRVMLSTSAQAHLQEHARELEATARSIQDCQHTLIPGLLQTAAYAQALFPLVLPVATEHSTAEAVAARMRRQEVLYDTSKRFEFLIAEAALWSAPGPGVMQAQLAKLESVNTVENVEVGIIPMTSAAGFLGSFTIYGDRIDGETVVAIELPHARITLDSPGDLEVYRQVFKRWHDAATSGAATTALIHRVLRALPSNESGTE